MAPKCTRDLIYSLILQFIDIVRDQMNFKTKGYFLY